jgi:hypothetical protein
MPSKVPQVKRRRRLIAVPVSKANLGRDTPIEITRVSGATADEKQHRTIRLTVSVVFA